MKAGQPVDNLIGSQQTTSSGSQLPTPRAFARDDLRATIVIIAAAASITLPILIRGFPNGDDGYVHYRWATEFHEAFREHGVLYPRWLSSANNGQGSPVMLYCPPLPLFVSEAINIAVPNTLLALELSCLIAMIVSGMTMYLFARSLLSPWMSLLASLLYMMAPYHVFDLYQRTALSEYWSFAWLPLVLHSIYQIAKGTGWPTVVYLGISFALLIFSHVIIAFALTLVIPIFILLISRSSRILVKTGAGLLLGLGIAAVFIAPIVFERDYARVHRALRLKYTNNFQFEALASAFKVPLFVRDYARIYFAEWVDVIAVCVLVLFVISAVVIWMTLRSGRLPSPHQRLIVAVFTISALSIFMTTRLSSPIWRAVPSLPYMQFPFRWLVVATFGTSLLAGVALSRLRSRFRQRSFYRILVILVTMFNLGIAVIAIARASHDRKPLDEGISALEVPEYRPVWWDNELHLSDELPSIAVNTGDAAVKPLDDHGIYQSYEVNARTRSQLRMRQLYFPGWQARIDDQPTGISPSEDGHLLLTVEPGEHRLTLRFSDTRPRAMGKLVSGTSVLISVLILLLAHFYRRPKSDPPHLGSNTITCKGE